MYGHNPGQGEIDIFEYVNNQTVNQFNMHSDKCLLTKPNSSSMNDCSAKSECVIESPRDVTFDGLLAFEWQFKPNGNLSVWMINRESAGAVDFKNVDPSQWPAPIISTNFEQSCAYDGIFNLTLIISLNFCGAYAGSENTWVNTCGDPQTTCSDYVLNPTTSLKNSYFSFNGIWSFVGDS